MHTNKEFSAVVSGKVFPDLLSAYKSVRLGDFFIFKKGVMYPFKWDMTAGKGQPVIFFTPGRITRGRPMPIFQRSKYFERLKEYNCVSCFDPTLFKDEHLTLAWFQGERKRFYALELAEIWSEFLAELKTAGSDVLYYGSSGGGIPGLYLSKSTPQCTLFVSNIQTDIRNYDARVVKKLVDTAFEGDDFYVKSAGLKQNRFSINGHSGAFHIIYAQNRTDVFHYERHYRKWRESTTLDAFKSCTFIEYEDSETGHGPLGADAEIEIIRAIVENRCYTHFFPGLKSVERIVPS